MQKDCDILSLDFGSIIGYCDIKDNVIIESGEADFRAYKGEVEAGNFLRFWSWLQQYANVKEIFFEKVDFIVNRQHAEAFLGFETITKVFCAANNIPFVWLTVNDWKKELTGHCRVGQKKDAPELPKNYEKLRICAKLHSLGWRGGEIGTHKNNNECDACAVAFAIYKVRLKELSFKRLDF